VVSVRSKPGSGSAQPGSAAATAELIVFADSAAWCARLRYVLAGLQQPIDARVGAPVRISVRVLMQTAASVRP